MPLYEYRCQDCDALLEVFQQPGDPDPRICGYRCALGPDSGADHRGAGQLTRALSAPAGLVRAEVFGDRPTAGQIERSGFTVYRNEGGKLKRSQGDKGPESVE
ncbi:MAG: zinc ribbon domain-containing protein [Alphaproteobacteria bacterium]|nr:zinc ribbon domain-containing protein [Alphaproteobacteria bacterium]